MVDLLIRNAVIVDGTGKAPYNGDVLINNGIIEAIGRFDVIEAGEVVDAEGRCLTPGFIDIHRHADLKVLGPDSVRQSCAKG